MKYLLSNNAAAISDACNVLRSGGVIVYPTDTVYGLGADATNPVAVELVRTLKGRSRDKPILAMVRDMAMLEEYAEVTPLAQGLAERFLPGPLALVLSARNDKLAPIQGVDGSVGFRIPNDAFCHSLSQTFGGPITSTSVNRSGLPQPSTLALMLKQLNNSADVALTLDAGVLPDRTPSTILDARGTSAVVLREGAVPLRALAGSL